jgi:predicted metal-binding protein
MPFQPVKPPYKTRQVLICTNVRDPSLNRASCGANGGVALRERLKASVKAAGRKADVMVTGTSCLGHCPANGCTVGIVPENEWLLMDINEEEEAQLLERILAPS